MDEIIKQLGPTLATALVAVVSAAVPTAVALLKLQAARIEAEHQAALGAVCELKAVTQPARLMSGPQKKAEAIQRAQVRLGRPVSEERVQEAFELEKIRPTSTVPPPDNEITLP